MKQPDYFKTFATKPAAESWMRMKNQAACKGWIFCLLEGPDDNFVVCDLRTAVDTGLPYSWAR